MILFINSCPREESRTRILARELLNVLGEYEEVNLYQEDLKPLCEESLSQRMELLHKGELQSPYFSLARQFASADKIVIAAPFWDLSFPSMLKVYLENIYITGIVSCYDEHGVPKGLCKAKHLYYVTTAGGPYDERFGFDYVKTLCKDYFGIPNSTLIKAEMLDVKGYDPSAILNKSMSEIRKNIKG